MFLLSLVSIQTECTIKTALPAQRKHISADTSITVEASEESVAEALSLADSLGMQIMGWYHSHPIFSTNPSKIDLATQHAHQKAFGGYVYEEGEEEVHGGKCEHLGGVVESEGGGKPFLGAICGEFVVGAMNE